MTAKWGIAAVALGLTLAGCGVGAATATRQQAAPPAPEVGMPAKPDIAAELAAEAGKPISDVQKTMIRRFFAYLESKNPQAKDLLHSLEQRLLALDLQKMLALKAIRYQERKDKTLDDIRKEVEGYIQDPAKLVANLGDDLDKVMAMSPQDLSATRAQLPPIFAEMMRAMAEKAKPAKHDAEDDDDDDDRD